MIPVRHILILTVSSRTKGIFQRVLKEINYIELNITWFNCFHMEN